MQQINEQLKRILNPWSNLGANNCQSTTTVYSMYSTPKHTRFTIHPCHICKTQLFILAHGYQPKSHKENFYCYSHAIILLKIRFCGSRWINWLKSHSCSEITWEISSRYQIMWKFYEVTKTWRGFKKYWYFLTQNLGRLH